MPSCNTKTASRQAESSRSEPITASSQSNGTGLVNVEDVKYFPGTSVATYAQTPVMLPLMLPYEKSIALFSKKEYLNLHITYANTNRTCMIT